ncbi:hypothetical protein Tco_0141214, partial [Tanacetum coccineum]
NTDGSRVEREPEARRPSERKGEDSKNHRVNLPLLLAAHLGRNENFQPLQSTLTSVYGGHQPSTNLGGNLPPNVIPPSKGAPPITLMGYTSQAPMSIYGLTHNGSMYPLSALPDKYGYIRNHMKTIKKTSKHGHENQKSTKRSQRFKAEARKVKPQSKMVNKSQQNPNP